MLAAVVRLIYSSSESSPVRADDGSQLTVGYYIRRRSEIEFQCFLHELWNCQFERALLLGSVIFLFHHFVVDQVQDLQDLQDFQKIGLACLAGYIVPYMSRSMLRHIFFETGYYIGITAAYDTRKG